jgi:hypothetical protein
MSKVLLKYDLENNIVNKEDILHAVYLKSRLAKHGFETPRRHVIDSFISKYLIGLYGNKGKNDILFYHFVWNLYNINDPIIKGDGYVIHHKDGNELNDYINNLQKMKHGDHSILHNIGNKYWLGKKHTEESKNLISKTKIKNGDSKGSKNPMYGKRFYGKDNPNFGNVWSEDRKKSYSNMLKEIWKNKKLEKEILIG